MVTWTCDICGKPTHVNPPVEPQWEERQVPVEMPDPNDPTKVTIVHVPQRLPKMAKMKQQNAFTGEIEDVDVQETKDLAPRTWIVSLSVGQDQIQKDFCKECLTEHVLPAAQALWDKLAAIKSQGE
jgi:hypothetical protein